MDKETELLSRLAANHLHLAQFEPLRATLLALRTRNPDLGLAILQTIVANSGRFYDILWSASCPSPSLLAFLSTLELLQFDNSTSSTWSFDPETLRLRSEFLLLVQMLIDRVVKRTRKDIDFDSFEKEKEKGELNETESFDEKVKLLDKSEELGDVNSEFSDCVRVLDRFMELGVKRLKPNLNINENLNENVHVSIEEGELMCLRKVILEYADVFDALFWNIDKQVSGWESFDSERAIVRREELSEEEDKRVLGLMQRSIQLAHLDAMEECLREEDEEGAVSRIRFLHPGYGVEEAEYRTVLEDLLKRVFSKRKEYADTWLAMQEKLLLIYTEALSSNCILLVKMIQIIQDELLLQEIDSCRALDSNQIPPPLERFLRFVAELKPYMDLSDKSSALNMAFSLCMRDMFHYSRVSGLHILECIMNTALSAVMREQLQEASNILMLYPRLQPLIAAMGWDLLSGKTTERRKLMQLLWTSKSQVYRLEESSLYGNQSNETSCVEHLCDLLCYQLDLASFVARVNSGQSWNSKFSLLLSGKEQEAFGSEDAQLDPFVENLILERLSAQSPLRVLFDVVPGIKFQDAIELISMQPIASDAAAWKRMQDIELMHMRYALDSTIFALGAMERTVSDERASCHQVALCHLKDLRNHLEAIASIPRKIFMVNVIISLLHMDDISLNLTQCASLESYSKSSSACAWEDSDLSTYEGGNKLVVSFSGLLLDILHHNLPPAMAEEKCALTAGISISGRQALERRISIAKRFIEDWEWRLSILQRLFPLSDRQWSWKEALTVLRAAPSKLLNLCMQRAKYDIGEEAVHRFSLSAEDRATLELAEWVDSTFRRVSVRSRLSFTSSYFFGLIILFIFY